MVDESRALTAYYIDLYINSPVWYGMVWYIINYLAVLLEFVSASSSSSSPQYEFWERNTALHIACSYGNTDALKALLAIGACVCIQQLTGGYVVSIVLY